MAPLGAVPRSGVTIAMSDIGALLGIPLAALGLLLVIRALF